MSRSINIALAVSSYMTMSISIVMLNKILLSKNSTINPSAWYNMVGYGFSYPITLTWVQNVIALVCVEVLNILRATTGTPSFWPDQGILLNPARWLPRKKQDTRSRDTRVLKQPSWFDPLDKDASSTTIAITVLPVTLIFLAMISLNNLCLQYVQASFYMVARSTHIFFNIVLSYFILSRSTSPRAIAACTVITAGIVVTSLGEIDYSPIGGLFGVLSTIFVALYSIFVKQALTALRDNQWLLLQYNTLLSVLLLPLVIYQSGELDGAVRDTPVFIAQSGFTIIVIASGICGIGVAIAAYVQIKLTSPLTHMVSGTVKGILQTGLAFWLFGNPYTSGNIIGTAMVIVGSLAYSLTRRAEQQQGKQTFMGKKVK